MVRYLKTYLLRILLYSSFCLIPFLSQSQNVFFEKISHNEGLYQNAIFDILQDNRGFLWFATPKGLIKYDGINYTVFEEYKRGESVFPIKKVFELHLDKEGNIWAGAASGIYKYDYQKEKITKIENTHISFLPNSSFVETLKNELLILVPSGLYKIIDDDKLLAVAVEQNHFFTSQIKINRLLHVRDSTYLFGGSNKGIGSCIYNSKNNSIRPISFNEDMPSITSICKESGPLYWIGFKDGFKRVKISNNGELEELEFSSYKGYSTITNNFVNDIFKSTDNQIYVATNGNGVLKINTEKKEIENFKYNSQKNSISWDNVNCIYEDNTGILWFGTGQGGVSKYDTKRKPFFHIKNNKLLKHSLSHDHINNILVDSKNYLWVGTNFGGINISTNKLNEIKNNNLQFETLPEEKGFRRSFMLFELQGHVIIGAYQTIYFYNIESRKLIKLNSDNKLIDLLKEKHITALENDNKGRLWIGAGHSTSKTLLCIDYGNEINNLISGNIKLVSTSYEDSKFRFSEVNKIYNSTSGINYIATDIGLFTTSEQENKIILKRFYNIPDDKTSISENNITTIFEDSKNRIWVGTFDGGLNLVQHDNKNQIIGFKHPQNGINLPERSIFSILEDDNENLWLSSYNGIYKYNYSNKNFLLISTCIFL